MPEDRVIVHVGEADDHDSYKTFRIDDHGIKCEGYRLLPWQDVQRVRAWVNVSDGDWGMDEFHCLELTYTDGYRLRATDASGAYGWALLYRLRECIRWFLPAIAPTGRRISGPITNGITGGSGGWAASRGSGTPVSR